MRVKARQGRVAIGLAGLLAAGLVACKRKKPALDRATVKQAAIELPAVEAASMIEAAALLASRTVGAWPLERCGQKPDLEPVLLVVVDDGRCTQAR